jgi:hypothetical protein
MTERAVLFLLLGVAFAGILLMPQRRAPARLEAA